MHAPLISAHRRQKQADICELKASPVIESSRTTQTDPVSKKKAKQVIINNNCVYAQIYEECLNTFMQRSVTT